jgi:hypothetical protein
MISPVEFAGLKQAVAMSICIEMPLRNTFRNRHDAAGASREMPRPLIPRAFKYFTRSVINPAKAFSLLREEKNFSVGFFLNALKWIVCEFYVYYLFTTNQVLFTEPWLNLPLDRYRFYELFFYIPYGILAWVLTAGMVQTLATAFGGRGTFTDTLNIAGIMIFTPFVFIDTIDALFMIVNSGDWHIAFNSITRSLYVLWSGVLLVIGLKIVHELKSTKSVLIALIVIPLTIFINLIFVR